MVIEGHLFSLSTLLVSTATTPNSMSEKAIHRGREGTFDGVYSLVIMSCFTPKVCFLAQTKLQFLEQCWVSFS